VTKTIDAIKACIEQAKKESVSKWGGKIQPISRHLFVMAISTVRMMKLIKAVTSSMPTVDRLLKWLVVSAAILAK
jgi:uncharacterized protein involved in tolerance to divalent cations